MKKEGMFLYGIGYNVLFHIIYSNIIEFLLSLLISPLIQIGNKYLWLWILIEPVHKSVVRIHISQVRNMLILSSFLEFLLKKYGRHMVYSDGGTWYPEACNVLGLKHYLHSSLEKSLMARVNQYFKNRIEYCSLLSCIRIHVIFYMYITVTISI